MLSIIYALSFFGLLEFQHVFPLFVDDRFADPFLFVPVVHDYEAADAFVSGGSHVDSGNADTQ